MQHKQHGTAAAEIVDSKAVELTTTDESPTFLGILDEMVADGVMAAGCRHDQNF